MLELDEQLRPVRATALGVLGLALLASGPWLGWWTLVPLALAAVGFRVAEGTLGGRRRPEYALFGAWAMSEAIIAAACAVAGGPSVPTTAWLAVPVLTLGARFSNRGIAVGVAWAIACLLGVEFGVNPDAVIANPPLLIAPIALIVCVALFQTVLMRSELRLRGEVVIDSLTGMFNRKALARRVDELEQQSRLSRQPVGLIVGDIDHFKHVNDYFGHAVGDALLTDVSYQLRKTLRAFDLCYRTGGEEFLVLLPGADVDHACALAEQLRREVSSVESGGRRVTMSFGVAASKAGEPFEYHAVFAEADAALYEAKRTGRDRVCRADALPEPDGAASSQIPAAALS